MEVYSAGTERYPEVKPLAVEAMALDGVDISGQYPKLLEEIPEKLDYLITMGCGVQCPFVPCDHREDWGLDDPSGGPIEAFVKTRNMIKDRVMELIGRVKDDQ